jgi:hypothetical protein
VLRGEGPEQERAGSTLATTRADGSNRTVMVLVLRCNRRRLTIDEVVAALAIQAVALIGQGGTAELATVSFQPSQMLAAPKTAAVVSDGAARLRRSGSTGGE